MATDSSRTLNSTTVLWAAFGAACALLLARSAGWASGESVSAADPTLLAGGVAFLLLLLGAHGLELARGRACDGPKWLGMAVLVLAVSLSGQPLFAALAGIVLVVGLAAPLALLVLAAFGRMRASGTGAPSSLRTPDGRTGLYVADRWFGPAQAGALAFVAGAALGIGLGEFADYQKGRPAVAPIQRARTVQVVRNDGAADPAARLALAGATAGTGTLANALLVDGTGGAKVVLFDHEAHQKRNNGEASCGLCHHRNLPLDRGTPCDVCHTRARGPADTFSHASHMAKLGGNASCQRCHKDGAAKTRAASTRCDDEACHAKDIRKESVVRARMPLQEGVAPGYVDAMHGLCVDCHRMREAAQGAEQPYLSRCTTCHQLVQTELQKFEHDTLLQPEVELERIKLEKAWIGRTTAEGPGTAAPARGEG